MHVDNASAFVKTVDTHVITGDTLIFDFIFFLHPVSAAGSLGCEAGCIVYWATVGVA